MIATGDGWELRLGDWRDVLADVECDAIICDPPYGARVHAVDLECNDTGITEGLAPGYDAWTPDHVMEFVRSWSSRCRGWMVALTSHDLVPAWEAAYADVNRYCFAPIPCVMRGMSVRMLGDGPSSWSVQAIVARPKTVEFSRWGAKDGAYTGPRGDESGGGRGKPDWLVSALVRDYSLEGNLVCDPFVGWGSTLHQSVALRRRAIGSERDEDAYAEAQRRLSRPVQHELWSTNPINSNEAPVQSGSSSEIQISKIKVGNRLRPLGDISQLAKSIAAIGLLHPITIAPDGLLIAGLHRLKACESIGWQKVPVNVVSLDELHRDLAEIDENIVKNELSALERGEHLARRKRIYETIHPETKHNGRGHGNQHARPDPESGSGQPTFVADTSSKTGHSRAKIAEEIAIVSALLSEVKDLIRATDTADNKEELKRLTELDADTQVAVARKIASGEAKRVSAAKRLVKRDTLPERIAALPANKHRVIYADPPWKYGDDRGGIQKSDTAAASQYPLMDTDEICELEVKSIAADDAVLFMWAVFPMLEDALAVIKAWGFKYKTAIVWDKQRSNLGNYHDARAELLMIATRGSCPIEIDTRPKQVQSIARGRHSAKPEEFRALIDEMYPTGPRVELFRRGEAPSGWTVWGNESEEAA